VHRFLLIAAVSLVACGCSTGGTGGGDSSGGDTRSGDREGVILLRYTQGSESTEQREEGFLQAMREQYPEIPILAHDQYMGTTRESSLDKAMLILNKYGDRMAGVFCVCEPNAMGMLLALEEAELAGEIAFVGFDPTPRMVQAMSEGKMDGIVLQDPVKMGYYAVKTMVDHLEGKEVRPRIDTQAYIATPENMDTDQMQTLLYPEQFSGEPFQPERTKYVIAVIPKGLTHEFWKSVHAGARNAARELGDVEIRWDGPINESDREGQINIVQDFITQNVDGICLAPLDANALVDVVKQAKEAGIPTVIYDSDLASDAKVSYVATDNFQGGRLAAKRLAEVLGRE